jgi:hypothetical protein
MQQKRKDIITYAENTAALSAELEEIEKNLEDANDSEEKATMALRMTREPKKNAARATVDKARALVTELQGKLEAKKDEWKAKIAAWKRKYPNKKRKYPNKGGSRRKNKTRRLR